MKKLIIPPTLIVLIVTFVVFLLIVISQSTPLNIWLIFGTILILSLISGLSLALLKIKKLNKQIYQESYITQKAAKIGSWDWDITNKCIHFSDTALKILDLEPHHRTLSNADFFALIFKADREKHLAALKAATNLKKPYRVEMRCNTQRPYKRWLDSRGEILFDKNNKPYRMIGMHQDITQVVIQRHLQEKMKTILQNIIEHQELHQILSKICDAIHEIEPSIYCVIYLTTDHSDKAQLIHSKSIPDALFHVLNSISIEEANSELQQTLKQSGTIYIEQLDKLESWKSANQLLNSKNITAFCGHSLISNKHTTEGAVCLYIEDNSIPREILNQILDITSGIASVALEGQHQADNQHEIQQQLYQSQKMDSIGHLTGGIAHDFNNILGSIVGYNSLAKKITTHDNNEKLSKYLNEVSIASLRARDLISQMMIFSRSEPTKNVLVDSMPIIKEVLQLIKSMMPSSITISHKLKADTSNISINPVALHQVIMNMLINAKDAAKDEKGSIFISLTEETIKKNKCSSCHQTFQGNYVCITIQDTGTGISSNVVKNIFDPFFTTKDIGQGTGMGLSVVHGIVHDSEGHVTVRSSSRTDTVFKLYFPAHALANQTKEGDHFISEEHSEQGNGEHIMVVDDDIPLSLLFEEILESYGYRVSRFDNSQLALEAFMHKPSDFNLILTDQTMPFLTGEELAKKVQSLKPELPIIICTGYSEKLKHSSANDLGISYLISKPIDMYRLLDIINDALINV